MSLFECPCHIEKAISPRLGAHERPRCTFEDQLLCRLGKALGGGAFRRGVIKDGMGGILPIACGQVKIRRLDAAHL